jgi:putative hydrolase of the HAD superfamily
VTLRHFVDDSSSTMHMSNTSEASLTLPVTSHPYAAALGLRLSDADFIAGWNNLYVGPVPGMVAVLAAATERLPLYAFTNSNPTHQAVWATRYACELSVFRSIFVSSELGLRKPDPNAFSEVV